MTTVTISLPSQISKSIDEETRRKGFATRSEFVRSLLRDYFAKELRLETFTPRSLDEVRFELARTGKYNQKFIESVMKGLSRSSAYARKSSST